MQSNQICAISDDKIYVLSNDHEKILAYSLKDSTRIPDEDFSTIDITSTNILTVCHKNSR